MSNMKRVSNANARKSVVAREEFQGSNTFGQNLSVPGTNGTDSTIYVCYSYGTHWPLFAFWNGQWYGNATKYGQPTTSKHHGQLYPHNFGGEATKIVLLEVEELSRFIGNPAQYVSTHAMPEAK